MQGLVSKSVDTRYAYVSGYGIGATSSTGVANASVSFKDSNISFICNGSATSRHFMSQRWCRGATNATATICTVGTIKNITSFNNLHVTGANNTLRATIRSGSANSASTTINSATIIKSGVANGLSLTDISLGNNYLVIGSINIHAGAGAISTRDEGDRADPGSVSYNADSTITEIYLA